MKGIVFASLLIAIPTPGLTATTCATDCGERCKVGSIFGKRISDPRCKLDCEVKKKVACETNIDIPGPGILPPNPHTVLNAFCQEPFDNFVSVVLASCTFTGFISDSELSLARQKLRNTGLLTDAELRHGNIVWCSTLSSDTNGMAPGGGRIVLSTKLKNNAFELAATYAHEVLHLRQQNNWGEDEFKCRYAKEIVKGNGQGNANYIEAEAYDFEAQVRSALQATWNNTSRSTQGASANQEQSEVNIHFIEKGDTLWSISKGEFGDGSKYLEIFEVNKDSISDPDLIFMDNILRIPNTIED